MLIPTTSEENSADALNGYTDEIFDNDVWLKKEVGQIAEVTYSYEFDPELGKKDVKYEDIQDAVFFNSTLFTSIGGLDYKEWVLLPEDQRLEKLKEVGEEVEKTVGDKLSQINQAISEINELGIGEEEYGEIQMEKNNRRIFSLKKEILVGSLNDNKMFLEQALTALPFELEKAGLEHGLSDEQIDAKIAVIEDYDTKLFGGKISREDNEDEIIRCYRFLRTKYEKKAGKVSEEESDVIKKSIEEIEKLLPEGYEHKEYNEPKKVTNPDINYGVRIEDYVPSYNRYLKGTKMKYRARVDPKVGSMTDTPTELRIADNEKSRKRLLEKVVTLMAHEFDGHTINLLNGIKLIGKTRGSQNITKEEGWALIKESLFLYGENFYKEVEEKLEIDKDKINVTDYHPKTLLAELLTGKELFEFLTNYEGVEKDNTTPLRRFLRLKRLRPLDRPGCQHKDTTYIRGQFEVADYLNSGENPIDLSLGKVGTHEVHKLVEIKRLLEENGEELDLIKPALTYEYVYYKLLKKQDPEKYRKICFKEYLKKKYPMFNLDFPEKPTAVEDRTKAEIGTILNFIEVVNSLNTNIEVGKLLKKKDEKEKRIEKKLKKAA